MLKVINRNTVSFFTSDAIKTAFWWRHNYVSSRYWHGNVKRKFLNSLIKWIFRTTRAKNYENMLRFDKDMLKKTIDFFSEHGVCVTVSAIDTALSETKIVNIFDIWISCQITCRVWMHLPCIALKSCHPYIFFILKPLHWLKIKY